MAQNVIPDHTQAATPHAAVHHDHGEMQKTGIWLFLVSETMLFAVLLAGYMMARWKDPEPHHVLNVPLTSLNTFILLMSSFTVVLALSSIQQGRRVRFLRFLAVSILLGSLFVGLQLVEYAALYHEGVTINTSSFGSTFFALTGFHGVHVFIGVLWLIRLFVRGFNGKFGPNDYWGVEMAGLYWHFVDVVWIFLFTIIYLF
jgi:heme/copper-type cytochrome/quinol oxidase subunit 3